MAKMKATVRNGRTTAKGVVFNANHNTRTETRNLEGHIDHERTSLNVNFKFFADGNIEKCGSFNAKEFELSQYEIYFGEGQNARNERYNKDGHPERCKTIKEVYEHPKTAPLETILQLGNMHTDIPLEERQYILMASTFQLIDSLRAKYGDNVKFLSYSCHNDEACFHGHLRYCFVSTDKFGYKIPNQSRAFAEMGVERPDTSKKEGKYNSPLMTFSAELRETFYAFCEKNGSIEIDREVKNPSQKHKDILEYKCEQLENSVAELIAERNTLRDQNSISKIIQEKLNEPEINIEAEIIPTKKYFGKEVEPEMVKIRKTDFQWLIDRAKLTIGIKTAWENLQHYGKKLWQSVNREKIIFELNNRIENAESLNRISKIEIQDLNKRLDLANEQIIDQQEFMQKYGIWNRFCNFVKERFRERETDISPQI